MEEVIRLLGVAIDTLRTVFSVVLIVCAVGATLAWAERSRRLNAFGGVARFVRAMMDPLIKPLEGRVVRMGGSHVSAPWWWLIAVLIGGALFIGVLGFVRGELATVYFASQGGARGMLRLVVAYAFTVLQLAVLVRVVISWVGGHYSWIGRVSHAMTEWFLGPLRRVLPVMGSIDISPIVAWFAIGLVQGLVLKAL